MKSFRQRVKELKQWMMLAKAGIIVMIASYLPAGVVFFLDTVIGIHLNISNWCIELMMYMLLFGWVIYGGMFVLSSIGIAKRNVCSECGKRIKLKELERMRESFICPYCGNKHFANTSEVLEK